LKLEAQLSLDNPQLTTFFALTHPIMDNKFKTFWILDLHIDSFHGNNHHHIEEIFSGHYLPEIGAETMTHYRFTL